MKNRNIRLVIEYDGTNYKGWQVQKSRVMHDGPEAGSDAAIVTVQGMLQEAIKEITGEEVGITGAGRTDSGVHARGQTANFHTSSGIGVERLPFAINAHLPCDIIVKSAEEVASGFNARKDAKAREYMYVINNHRFRSAIARLYSYHVPQELDLEAMGQAADCFKGLHDFSGFTAGAGQKPDGDAGATRWVAQNRSIHRIAPTEETSGQSQRLPPTYKNIMKLDIERRMEFIYIIVKANSFLMHMVRYMTAALLEVGKGKMGPEDIRLYLEPSPRKWTGSRAPARGLFLMKVEY
ncbi:MAG: tRNA pseudouridine synthase A [Deltaproteobacteria bacterium]|nr:tRNA pseudouridine synthase A [Deltaproteobacteria bacterium]MCL5277126.1 tRNA pseudouridine synthase A [Deltaproteobacteria bacterium]